MCKDFPQHVQQTDPSHRQVTFLRIGTIIKVSHHTAGTYTLLILFTQHGTDRACTPLYHTSPFQAGSHSLQLPFYPLFYRVPNTAPLLGGTITSALTGRCCTSSITWLLKEPVVFKMKGECMAMSSAEYSVRAFAEISSLTHHLIIKSAH